LLLLTAAIHAALPKAQCSIRWDSEIQLHKVDRTTGRP
jgi:hypothetical protein